MKHTYQVHKEQVGKRFKQFREMVEKTWYELAANMKVDVTEIMAVERGITLPCFIEVEYLFRQFGMNPTWLLFGTGEPFLHGEVKEI
jgi:transcriptional regulator with XRE-family HTH domain